MQDQSVIGKLTAPALGCSEFLLRDVASCWVHVPLCVCEFLALGDKSDLSSISLVS